MTHTEDTSTASTRPKYRGSGGFRNLVRFLVPAVGWLFPSSPESKLHLRSFGKVLGSFSAIFHINCETAVPNCSHPHSSRAWNKVEGSLLDAGVAPTTYHVALLTSEYESQAIRLGRAGK
eukprot:scpid31105/ scgid16330/ 